MTRPAANPFYASAFGWSARTMEGYTEFQLDGTSVAGCMDMPDMVPAEVPSYWMPYFAASDPQAKAQEAASLGATVLVPLMEFGGGRFSVVQDPVKNKVLSSRGEFGWGGAASTAFWIDPAEQITVLFLTQLLPSSTHPIRPQLRQLVNQALIA